MTLILGIETSCDETACAVVKDGAKVLASALATSAEMHQKTGGVIPEIAARKQVEAMVPVIEDCIRSSQMLPSDIDAIAVTAGPGLIGSLIVGVESAKALALAWDKPIVPVNHLVGHIYGNFIDKDPSEIDFPAVVLIVSGGHTDLILMKGHGEFEYIGGTLDDACGESFDKVARLLDLAPYMGGPAVSKAAKLWEEKLKSGDIDASHGKPFKRPMLDSKDFNFSFSGIKTAVLNRVKTFEQMNESVPVEETAYEFQEAVTDVLVAKTMRAAEKFGVRSIMLAGGVSANVVLREKLKRAVEGTAFKLFIPQIDLCTDNAVYIAACAHFNFKPMPFEKIQADPSLTVMSVF